MQACAHSERIWIARRKNEEEEGRGKGGSWIFIMSVKKRRCRGIGEPNRSEKGGREESLKREGTCEYSRRGKPGYARFH